MVLSSEAQIVLCGIAGFLCGALLAANYCMIRVRLAEKAKRVAEIEARYEKARADSYAADYKELQAIHNDFKQGLYDLMLQASESGLHEVNNKEKKA